MRCYMLLAVEAEQQQQPIQAKQASTLRGQRSGVYVTQNVEVGYHVLQPSHATCKSLSAQLLKNIFDKDFQEHIAMCEIHLEGCSGRI